MNTNLLRIVSSIIFSVFFLINSSKAADIVAADLAYEHISGNKYKVILTVYKECKAIANDLNAYQVDYSSISCRLQGNFIVNKISETIIPSCGSQLTLCKGGTGLGFNKIVYTSEVELPGKCNDWKFIWSDNNRSESITTVKDAVLKNIYIDAGLNNLDFPSNNSPVFSDPNSFITVGAPANISLKVAEKDGDRIEYGLIAPRDRLNVNLPYNSPFTFTSPLTASPAFILNITTGAVTFTPTVGGQRTVYAVKISEFRNNKLVGYVIRDLQIVVLDGKNAVPEISGFNNGPATEITFTTGKSNAATIRGSDKDPNQSLTMTWDNGVPSPATFSITNGTSATGSLSWRPTDADVGTKTFTVTLKDDFCPSAQTTKTFTVKVVKSNINPLCATLSANFAQDTLCIGKPTKFVNFSSPSANITSYSWDFGNGMKSDLKTPETKNYYDKPGDYTLKLIIKDDKNKCADTLTRILKVCEPPKVDFLITSEDNLNPDNFRNVICEKHKLKIEDKSTSTCSIIDKELVLSNGNKYIFNGNTLLIDNLSGIKSAKLTITTQGNCLATLTKPIDMKGGPQLTTIGSYDYKCNDLDTTVSVNVSGGTPIDSPDPDKRYSYRWSATPAASISILPNATSKTVKITYPALSPGIFVRVVAIDAISCTADTIFSITNPLRSSFKVKPYCKADDEISFITDTLVASTWGIKSFNWNFGDGTTSTLAQPKHLYAVDSFYVVSLNVEDNSTCKATYSDTIFRKLPVKLISLSDDTICLRNSSVNYDGNFFNGKNRGILYSWTWNGQNISNMKSGTFAPSISGSGPFKVYFQFNETGVGNCIDSLEKPLFVWPLADVSFEKPVSTCVPEKTNITTKQISGLNPIVTYNWEFFSEQASGARVEVSSDASPSIALKNNGKHNATLKLTDSKGCTNTSSLEEIISVKMLPTCATIDGFCQTYDLSFSFICPDVPVERPGFYAPIQSQKWDFGDGNLAFEEYPFNAYDSARTYIVKYIGYSNLQLKGCTTTAQTTLKVRPQPISKFTNTSECIGKSLTFMGDSIPSTDKDDIIKKYKWIFSNTYAKTDSSGQITDSVIGRNINYTPKFPTQLIPGNTTKLFASYITTNIYGCDDTLTKEVIVYPKPQADFELSDEDLEAFKSVQFKDKSFSAPPSNLSSWTYDFGDGKTENSTANGDISHTYNAIEIYSVKLVVKNNFGCVDSITKKLDLNAYLVVPNAITPNDDKAGDKFELVYKGIKKVNSYKIYNRWGQVVFDGANDLNASWDGTFNGEEQPMGVYVYYVSATTIYGTEIVLSENLTLIR